MFRKPNGDDSFGCPAIIAAAAQRSAILRGHDMVVAVDPNLGRMRIHTDANNDGQIQGSELWKVVDLQDGVSFGVTTAPLLSGTSGPITFSQKQGVLRSVTFHRNGSASERGFFYITGSGGGAQAESARAVEVVRSTAKIRCWSYQTGTWMETC